MQATFERAGTTTLGYGSAKTIPLDGKPTTFAHEVDHDDKLSRDTAFLDKWREVRFLFQLTNDGPELYHSVTERSPFPDFFAVRKSLLK